MADQLIELPLGGGLDEKTARKLVGPGSFLDLVNTRFDRNGQISQRYGTISLTTNDQDGNEILSGRAGHGYNGYPVLCSNDHVYVYSDTKACWVDRGRISTPQVTRKPLLEIGPAYVSVDHAYSGSLHFVAVENGQSSTHQIWVGIFDDAKGQWLRGLECISTLASDSRRPNIFVCGTRAVCVYWQGGNILAHTLTIASPFAGWSASTTLITTANGTNPIFDARPIIGHATNFVIGSADTNALKKIQFSIWDSTNLASAVASSLISEGTSPEGIGVYARNGDSQYWLGWGITTGGVTNIVRSVGVNTSTASENYTWPGASGVFSNTVATDGRVIRFAFTPLSTTRALLWCSQGGEFATKPSIFLAAVNGGSTTVDSTSRTYWIGLLSQPWIAPSSEANTRHYVCAQLYSTVQSTNYICEIETGGVGGGGGGNLTQLQICARFATRQVGQSSGSRAEMTSLCVPAVPNPQSGRYYAICNVVAFGTGSGQRVLLSKVTIEYEPDSRWRGGAYRQSLRMGGGCPQVFDGRRAYEEGFHWYPEIISVSKTGASGGLSTGNYLAVACYVFTLASGEVIFSAPSPPISFSASANDKATYSVRTYTAGAMRSYTGTQAVTSVAIICYRTQVGGQTFNAISDITLTSVNANDPTTNQVSIDDTQTDANIATNLPLYTDGTPGALENLCPPSLYPIVIHAGRAWGIDDSRRRVYYTDESSPGEAPRWHDDQTIDIDEGEDLVGFIPLDGALCVGTAAKLFRLDGQAANRFGQGTLSYSYISATAGMGGIFTAKYDEGTMFQSPGGELKLLSRGFAVEDVGYQIVQSSIASPFMANAVSHGTERELRFVVSASASASTGEVLVFETERKQWCKRQYQADGATSVAISDAWMVGTTCYFLKRGTAKVLKENYADWTDDAVFNEMTLGFPFVSMGSIQGYQRTRKFLILGDRYTAHDVEMKVYYDGSETSAETVLFSDGVYGTLDPFELEHSPARQKNSRFRVQIKTKAPTGGGALGTGQAVSWQMLTFAIETYEGARRTRPAVRG